MSTFEKTKDKIMHTPTLNDIMPNELQAFLDKYGFKLKHVKGSHFIYEYPPVKPTYIDQVRERIMEIEGESEQ